MNLASRPPALSDAVLTEAVHWIEQAGPLDDAAALRAALHAHPDAAGRIAHRARTLGQRLGLQAELARARHWAPWVGAALVLLIVCSGLALAGSVVGGGERRINIMVALASLLGLHLVTLGLWLLGLVLPLASFNVSLGGLWLALTARVAGGQRGQAPALLRAVTQLLARARLLPWALGLVSHVVWSLSFIVVLGALLFALAFRSYTLSWETTILEPDFFVQAVRALGWAPSWLGFPVPDAATVLAPFGAATGGAGSAGLSGASVQRSWALWLTGCIVVYGLLPRLGCAVLSALVWQRRKGALQPDLGAPYYRQLQARFEALAPAVIVDADPGLTPLTAPAGLAAADTDGTLLAGFELPPDHPWPPAGLPATVPTLRIDGSAAARRELLDTVARRRPRTLLIACRAAASPDRGTERLLRELLAHCGECRLWLDATPPTHSAPSDPQATAHADPAARARWRQWLRDVGLERITAYDDLAGALQGEA